MTDAEFRLRAHAWIEMIVDALRNEGVRQEREARALIAAGPEMKCDTCGGTSFYDDGTCRPCSIASLRAPSITTINRTTRPITIALRTCRCPGSPHLPSCPSGVP